MIINNVEKLKYFLKFEPGTYYKFVVLLREKDGSPILKAKAKREWLVKQWLIGSQQELDANLSDMLTFADLFNGRLYVCTDKKSITKTLFNIHDQATTYIKDLLYSEYAELSCSALNKIVASASSVSTSSDKNDRYWLIDIDTKDMNTVSKVITSCKSSYITTLETKNGYHVIAKRNFDGNSIELDKVEVKANSLALVYLNVCDI